MLDYNSFEILKCIERDGKQSQRNIAKNSNLSIGTVNKLIGSLADAGYINNGEITNKGLSVLEPYRVKRAVLLAAGFGSRMMPITLNTPKPLVKVNGIRIIDTLIDALLSVGITEIYIVRGYLKEQFDVLLEKYPTIKFIDNEMYNQTNNISSALCAKDKICNAYVMESDLLLKNPRLISKYQYETNYLGIKVDRTDDYCIYTKGRYIKKVGRGGKNCYQTIGITYWTQKDGEKMVEDIKDVYENVPGGKESFWGMTATVYHIGKYRIAVRECKFDDVVEIDSFQELCNIDHLYKIQ